MGLVVRVENLPSPEHVLWLIINYEYDGNRLKLLDIEHRMGKYLSEKLSLRVWAQVYQIPALSEGVTVRVASGDKTMFYSYESLLQKDVFMLRIFKDFVFA
jgi:hypothetical protein